MSDHGADIQIHVILIATDTCLAEVCLCVHKTRVYVYYECACMNSDGDEQNSKSVKSRWDDPSEEKLGVNLLHVN